jgi:peptidyl-prolyl cis-trans isomerase A (cyclophilin A)
MGGCLESKNKIAVIETTMGTIKVELFEDKAPITTKNFIRLAKEGFYTNLVFHRVINGFVIQGGGFYANGTRKESPYGTIKLEIHPEARHVDGAIAMARTLDPDSASSQFYICDGAQPDLDGEYAVFGVVIEGMDVVRSIASVKTTTKYGMRDWPQEDVIIKSIKIV